ncbi:MAG TPA: Npt1/Npt2 family nucleotide transporter [Terriglobia bacterium]|nr:Npt1/Npt2 family nucleotide transporter [Terriglobia bacterium]
MSRYRSMIGGAPGAQESERTRLALMSVYLLIVIACYTITRAARDSLLVAGVGPSQLPLLYILTAAGIGGVAAIYPKALSARGVRSVVRWTTLVAIVCLVVFWRAVERGGRLPLYALYVWVSVFGAVVVSQAWSLANHALDAREARRGFAWIGLGGVVGGILGGGLAGFVASWYGAPVLLPMSAALLAATFWIVRRLESVEARARGGPAARRRRDNPGGAEEGLRGNRKESSYVSTLASLLFAGVIVEAFIDYEFKTIAGQGFASADRLAAYFGGITSCGGVLALLTQSFLTQRVLKRCGAGAAIVLLPIALLIAFLLVAAQPTLWAVSILKLTDGCLSYSVHRSGMELLYLPISARARAAAKARMDTLVDRGGRAVGGVLLLALTAGFALSLSTLSLVASGALVVWLGIALTARRGYVEAFRTALARRAIEPEGLRPRGLDRTTRRALEAALTGTDERQTLYALSLLGLSHSEVWRSRLPSLLQHPSAAVREETVSLLTASKTLTPEVEPLWTDASLDVRVQAVRHFCEAGPQMARSTLRELLANADYRVVLAAVHYCARYRPSDADLIGARTIERALVITGADSVAARTAAAQALGVVRVPRARQFLNRLLDDPNPEVAKKAIWACGQRGHRSVIPRLIAMLAERSLRWEATEALLKMGNPALRELLRRFNDDATPMNVRRRIPKVCSMFGSQEVADLFIDGIHHMSPVLDIPLTKALNRMRSRSGRIRFEPPRVVRLIEEEARMRDGFRAIQRAIRRRRDEQGTHGTGEIADLLERALGERLDESRHRVLRFLHLIYDPVDIRTVQFNVSASPERRAGAVEFLDNLLTPALRELVVPIVEGRENESGREREELSCDEALQTLLEGDDAWLKAIARELVDRSTPARAASLQPELCRG